jgi:uncharacterized protein YbbC (DUF1343 family)/CubicO group peptidase (beta-lactamase class C family)
MDAPETTNGNDSMTSTLLALLLAAPADLHLKEAPPADLGFDPKRLAQIDAVVEDGIKAKKMPGCVVLVARHGKIAHFKAYGKRAVEPNDEPLTKDAMFDLASITKPVATACSIMHLVERGALRLGDRLADHVPNYLPDVKSGITIRQLLTHTAGFIPDNPMSDYEKGVQSARDALLKLKPTTESGTKFVYSDVGFLLLGELVYRKTGKTVAEYARENLFQPLGMADTMFTPPASLHLRCVPTDKSRNKRVIRGEVHDPRAYALGGVAGHAGLFSTAADLAVFAQMLHGGGRLGDVRVFGPRTVDLMTRPQTLPGGVVRAHGWDMRSSYSSNRGETFSDGAFGHGGFTGTAMWIDRNLGLTVIFLSSRLHPEGKGVINPLAGRIGTVAASAILSISQAPIGPRKSVAQRSEARTGSLPVERLSRDYLLATEKEVKGVEKRLRNARSDVLTGVDVLQRDGCKMLQGKSVALVTNHTGLTSDGVTTIDLLHKAPGVKLKVLFSPEHGLRGEKDENVGDGKDAKTGLPVISLYSGPKRKPTPESLQGVDVVVYDIQDIGCRFYTYISTLGLCMEAAAEAKTPFIVLDRPNPIGGVTVAGPMLDAGKESFVGYHRIPVQHGLTVGELAQMFKQERNIKVDLTVVKVENWNRSQAFDETGLTWVNPSPNMRSLTEAFLYPGIGLLETTNLSVGRGTDTPFEVIGAPWLDGRKLAGELNGKGLKGVRFVPIAFTPTSSKFKDEHCKGVNIAITDRAAFDSLRTGLAVACALRKLHPNDWKADAYARLLGNDETLAGVKRGMELDEIVKLWSRDLEEFQQRRAKALLYR